MSKRIKLNNDIARAIHELETDGVTVFPILSPDELTKWNQAALDMVRTYPEFENAGNHPVMGGFGAHATPSSYHHPVVQELRTIVFDRFNSQVIPVLAKKHGFPFWHMLFDRVCTRGPESSAVTKESWHFDHCDDSKNSNIPEKQLTGGWLNLNVDQDQFFFGLKGKFGTEYLEGGKYRPLPVSVHPELEQFLKDQNGPIVVPPGHLICFKPELAHKVNPGKTPALGVRLYLGTVLSSHSIPLFHFGRERILANELGYTGSGQRPPMWAANTWCFYPEKIQEWTAEKKPSAKYLETVTVSPTAAGKNAGKTFTRIKRFIIEPVQVYEYSEKSLSIMLPMAI